MTLPTIGRTVIYQHVTGNLVSYGGSTSGSQKVKPIPATVRARRSDGALELQIVEDSGRASIVVSNTQGDERYQWNWPNGTREREAWDYERRIGECSRLYDSVAERCAKAEFEIPELKRQRAALEARVESVTGKHQRATAIIDERDARIAELSEQLSSLSARYTATCDSVGVLRAKNAELDRQLTERYNSTGWGHAYTSEEALNEAREELEGARDDLAVFERFARASRAMLGSFTMKPGGSFRGLISQLGDATQEHNEARDAAFALLDEIDEAKELGTVEEEPEPAPRPMTHATTIDLDPATIAQQRAFAEYIGRGFPKEKTGILRASAHMPEIRSAI